MKLTLPPTAVPALCRPRLGMYRVHANAMMRVKPLGVKPANLILVAGVWNDPRGTTVDDSQCPCRMTMTPGVVGW